MTVTVEEIRSRLIQRGRALELLPADVEPDDEALDNLLTALAARETAPTPPSPDECYRYYSANRQRFRSGDIVEASHILVAVTPGADLEALRRQAETLLKQVSRDPARFAEMAQRLSNCPSSVQGGNLGQIHRGEMLPEFEQALFDTKETGVLPRLVNTRHGFHIVRVERRIAGRELDFDTAQPFIARYLEARAREKAAERFIARLASVSS